ncbi:MAG: 50S ribosome-binding GTPase [candidate division WOR-3 bacterium]|nr:50S ribosome-binding GTPase [candidate division WOR-3 bacterium]
MPANLTPQYLEAEKRFRNAKTTEEKIVYLQEMLALIPKHKGTEKLQAEIKSRLSKLRKEQNQKSQTRRAVWYHIEKQGAGQVAVFGAPNVGKSSIVKILTNASTEIAPYPFTTTTPIAGMMIYEDIQIQLIDCPPLTEDSPPWYFHILRSADSTVFVIDAVADDLVESTEICIKRLKDTNIIPSSDSPISTKPMIVVANKTDEPNALLGIEIIKEMICDLPIVPVSTKTYEGLEDLKAKIFKSLDIIRVYTKPPGKPPDLTEPVIIKSGSTILDAGKTLHKDFAKNLKFARLWDGDKYHGQRVERTHILKDKDIVEFHI